MEITGLYLGGPTALFEWKGLRILTDPTFDPAGGSYTTGPVTLKKLAGPALEPEALGRIDVVLLSHDHHSDNLDHAGRKLLAQAGWVLTTSEGAERLGGKTVGLAPWESVEIPASEGRKLRVTATPAQHGPANLQRGAVIGFAAAFSGAPEENFYFAGDTVWFEGVEEVARRFKVRVAALNLGAARVPVVGDFPLTMTAEDGVKTAQVFARATIVPLHFEGWAHFSESRDVISKAFEEAGVNGRVQWLPAGVVEKIR